MAETVVSTPGSSFSELSTDDLMTVDGGCCALLVGCLINICSIISWNCAPKQSCGGGAKNPCTPAPVCKPACPPVNPCIANGSKCSW